MYVLKSMSNYLTYLRFGHTQYKKARYKNRFMKYFREKEFGHLAYMCSSCAHGGLQNKMNWNIVTKPSNQKAIKPTRKSRISAFQGALIEGSSPVLSWDMVVLMQKNWKFGRFVKNAKNHRFFTPKWSYLGSAQG